MRQYLIAANWKMNGNKSANTDLLNQLCDGLAETNNMQVVISAPFVYLDQALTQCANSAIKVAAQNVSEFDAGAFTGEISAEMLADIGCEYALVGHSERRQLFHENDQQVASKFVALQEKKIKPILCLGETLEQREAQETEQVVAKQLNAVIEKAGIAAFNNAALAYEPVWAIGTGKTASPKQAQAVHNFLRSELAKHDSEIAKNVQIVYGGSVNENTAAELFAQEDIDGGLIGGASLKAESFLNICKVIDRG